MLILFIGNFYEKLMLILFYWKFLWEIDAYPFYWKFLWEIDAYPFYGITLTLKMEEGQVIPNNNKVSAALNQFRNQIKFG